MPAQAARPLPRDTVLAGALEVDRAPVTNARFAAFVEATGHRAPAWWPRGACPDRLRDHPVVGVDFFDALAFARWAQGSVPTEEEWLLASGLPEPKGYAWGPEFSSSLCNTVRSGEKGTTRVGTYPAGAAPSGCVDLCGNVWEMTATAAPGDAGAIVVKGGSWYDFPVHARLETRFRMRPDRGGNTIGFRLVYGRAQALPPGLAADAVEREIALRRAPAAGAPLDDVGRIAEELREDAEGVLPAIDPGLVAAALTPEEAPAGPSRPRAPLASFAARALPVAARFLRRPGAILAALALAVAGATVAVLGAATGERGMRAAPPDAPERPQAPTVRAPPKAPPARPAPAPVDELARAMDALRQGDGARREEAERWLVEHAARTRDAVAAAVDPLGSGLYHASLRYVLEAIDERPLRPWILDAPPADGLVLFLEEVDAAGAAVVAAMRRTARAEGLPAALVVRGADARDVIERFGPVLGDIGVHADPDGELSRRFGASGPVALIGLRRDGRLAFVHRGNVSRTLLAGRALILSKG
jgi:hypothetical protein